MASDIYKITLLVSFRSQLAPSDSFTPKSYMYCRACLCEFTDETGKSSNCYNIFEISDLAEKLSQCSNQPVVQWDEYPQSICANCYKKIDYLSQFQTMCRSSLEKFNNMLHDPSRVTFDFGSTLNDSFNSIDNDTNTNPFLNDVEVPYKDYPTEQRCKETNVNKNDTSKESIDNIYQESKSDISKESANETSKESMLSYSKSDIEFDEMIEEEIIQVEIERNAEYNDHINDEETEVENIPLQMEKICDVIENTSIEVESEEFHLEIEDNVIEEKVMEDKEVNLNDYIINEQEVSVIYS